MITAECPASGCGRTLPIHPDMAYDTYTCPCDRRCVLDVAYTRKKEYVLREHRPDEREKLEINLIAHALVTGQATEHAQPWRRALDTAPDPASAGMYRAHMAAHRLFREAANLMTAGHFARAVEVAERGRAAERAYDLHARQYTRAAQGEVHEAVWHNAERFYIEDHYAHLPSQPPANGQPRETELYLMRFTFPFLALWDEERAAWEVANAGVLEVVSGLEVGEDGWRELMALLVYLRGETVNGERAGKPGRRADPYHLIFRQSEGRLRPLPVVQRFPRALLALLALRRCLTAEAPAAPEVPAPEWAAWSADQIAEREGKKRRSNPEKLRRGGWI